MLIKKNIQHKKQLALMAGLSLGTITSTNTLGIINSQPQLVTKATEKLNEIAPIRNLVAVNASAAVVQSVPKNSYGIDISDYQGNDMGPYARAGAKFVIIKVAEGYYPGAGGATASQKVQSAIANNMMVMGYHFYHYNGSVADARKQANVAINAARNAGIPIHSYLALDWESENGRGQNCGSMAENTAEALAWMQTVRNAGYLPMLYSGSAYLKTHFNRAEILKQFPGSFWVAQYPYSTYNNPAWKAPMESFPSMDGVAIWQFTNDMYGKNTDGNINVLPLQFLQPEPSKPSQPTQATTTVRFVDTDSNNKIITTQKVSGNKGNQQTVNIPANYNANTNKITNNGGTVDVKLTHKTQKVSEQREYTTITGSKYINIPDGVTFKNPDKYFVDNNVPYTVTGVKDLVTGQTKWNQEPSVQDVLKSTIDQVKQQHPNAIINYIANKGANITIIHDYNALTNEQKEQLFNNVPTSNAGSSTPATSDNSSSVTSRTPATSDNSSSTSSNIPITSDNSSIINLGTPITNDNYSSASSNTPATNNNSSNISSSTPVTSDNSSNTSSSMPVTSDNSSNASSSTPAISNNSSNTSSSIPVTSDNSSNASSSTPAISDNSSNANSSIPVTSNNSSNTSSSTLVTNDNSSNASSNTPTTNSSSGTKLNVNSGNSVPSNVSNNLATTALNNAANLAQTNMPNKQNGSLLLALIGSTLLLGTLTAKKTKIK